MRVAKWYNNRDVRVEEMATPEIGAGEILVRVEASGLCGTDALEWYRLPKAPLVLGHEIAGEVVAVGEGVQAYRKGDRVCVAHHVPCGACRYCLRGHETVCETLRKTNFDPGGFAEYVRLPSINVDRGVFPIPEGLSFDEASLAEPLACVLRGLRMSGLTAGDTLLVLGSGIAGLLYVQLARGLGANRVVATDVAHYRLAVAERFGADVAIHAEDYSPERLREVNDGWLADVVIVCTGAVSAIEQALASMERGGTVLLFAPTAEGITFPLSVNDLFFRNDVTLTTSYAGSPADYAEALRLIGEGKVRVGEMITHRLSLGEVGRGFHLLTHPEEEQAIKIVLQPQR